MIDISTIDVSLPDLMERAGAKPRMMGGEYRAACPLHSGHNNTGFAAYQKDGKWLWTCFSGECGSGDTIDFVMKWRGLDFLKAVEYLGGKPSTNPGEFARLAQERAERATKALEEQIAKAQQVLTELRQAQTWIRYHQTLQDNHAARDAWTKRGVPEAWQDIWRLGYTDSFTVNSSIGQWSTPTLAMPIFSEGDSEQPVNVRHRLIYPPTPTDKYRPDRPGLPAAPFICDPDNKPDNVLIVEGEIKAMVSYITLDSNKWQVIGIPGKKIFNNLLPQLVGRKVVICLDPDALEESETMARAVGGRVIEITDKIDDAINAGQLDRDTLRKLIRTSRKVGK